jgi:hypothetical protein
MQQTQQQDSVSITLNTSAIQAAVLSLNNCVRSLPPLPSADAAAVRQGCLLETCLKEN